MKIQAILFHLFLLLICCGPNFLGAQVSFDSEKINAHSLKLNYLLPGIEYEVKVIEDFTLSLRTGFNFSGLIPNVFAGSDPRVKPFGEVQIRRYFRTKEKSNKGKTMIGNSGDYFGLRGMYTYVNNSFSGDDLGNYILIVGPMYGLQRTFQNKLTWSFHAGIGGIVAGANLVATPFLGVSIGSVLFTKD